MIRTERPVCRPASRAKGYKDITGGLKALEGMSVDHFCPPKCESAAFLFFPPSLYFCSVVVKGDGGPAKPQQADCCFYGLRSVSHLGRIKSLSSLKDVIWNGERLHNGYIRCVQTARVSGLCRGGAETGASYRRRLDSCIHRLVTAIFPLTVPSAFHKVNSGRNPANKSLLS